MILWHPGVARVNCQDCLLRQYEFDTGEPMKHTFPDGREVLYDLELDPSYKPRCLKGEECPRGNPTEGPTHDPSRISLAILEAFFDSRGVGFVDLTPEQREDAFLMQCFSTLASLLRKVEKENQRLQGRDDLLESLLIMKGATR